MIKYNMRYRGPYEYDKFALNIFQFSNAVNDVNNYINTDKNTFIKEYANTINSAIDSLYDDGNLQDIISKYMERIS